MISSDAIHIFELNSDPEVVKYTGDLPSHDFADAQRILQETVIPQFHHYKMGRFAVLTKDNKFLGWCGLKYFPDTKDVDIGFRFHKKFWGNGYAVEASKAILKYGFEDLNLKKILARSMPQNLASIKVLQKLGMTYRGIFNDPTYPHGFVLYELTAEEFAKCKS
jgi:[ribosomal protein S5]-alanine N-acetyltransferase